MGAGDRGAVGAVRVGPAWLAWGAVGPVPGVVLPGGGLSGGDQPGVTQSEALSEAAVSEVRLSQVTFSEVTLSPVDGARAASFGARRWAEFVTGRALVRGLLAEVFPGAEAAVTSAVCPHCGEPHGGILVEGVDAMASVSHAGGCVVAAVAASGAWGRRLGVDLELVAEGAGRLDDLVGLIGGPRDDALRRWTLIEAVLKADGRGLRVDPADVRLRARPRASARIAGDAVRYRVAEVPAPPGWIASLAWA